MRINLEKLRGNWTLQNVHIERQHFRGDHLKSDRQKGAALQVIDSAVKSRPEPRVDDFRWKVEESLSLTGVRPTAVGPLEVGYSCLYPAIAIVQSTQAKACRPRLGSIAASATY